MTITDDLMREIWEGAEALGIARTTLCQRAVSNSGLVRRLENGGRVTLETAEAIRTYIAANRPKAEV